MVCASRDGKTGSICKAFRSRSPVFVFDDQKAVNTLRFTVQRAWVGKTTCSITEENHVLLSLHVWSKQVTNLNRCHSQNIIDGCVCTPVYVCCCKPIQNMCIACARRMDQCVCYPKFYRLGKTSLWLRVATFMRHKI